MLGVEFTGFSLLSGVFFSFEESGYVMQPDQPRANEREE
jgi:hypothetical protein